MQKDEFLVGTHYIDLNLFSHLDTYDSSAYNLLYFYYSNTYIVIHIVL